MLIALHMTVYNYIIAQHTKYLLYDVIISIFTLLYCKQHKAIPREFQEVKVPRFHDNGTGWW